MNYNACTIYTITRLEKYALKNSKINILYNIPTDLKVSKNLNYVKSIFKITSR